MNWITRANVSTRKARLPLELTSSDISLYSNLLAEDELNGRNLVRYTAEFIPNWTVRCAIKFSLKKEIDSVFVLVKRINQLLRITEQKDFVHACGGNKRNWKKFFKRCGDKQRIESWEIGRKPPLLVDRNSEGYTYIDTVACPRRLLELHLLFKIWKNKSHIYIFYIMICDFKNIYFIIKIMKKKTIWNNLQNYDWNKRKYHMKKHLK